MYDANFSKLQLELCFNEMCNIFHMLMILLHIC